MPPHVPNMQAYMKAKYANLPEVEVTREEFIKMMVDNGKPQKDAELHATMCEGLGSACMMGGKMVSIKKEVKDETIDTSE
jgi:hypothetical protein